MIVFGWYSAIVIHDDGAFVSTYGASRKLYLFYRILFATFKKDQIKRSQWTFDSDDTVENNRFRLSIVRSRYPAWFLQRTQLDLERIRAPSVRSISKVKGDHLVPIPSSAFGSVRLHVRFGFYSLVLLSFGKLLARSQAHFTPKCN